MMHIYCLDGMIVPVVLWVTFDSFCKHINSLTVLALIYQSDPLFCNGERKPQSSNLKGNKQPDK